MRISPQIITRGTESYQTSFDAMRAFTDQRTAETPDQLWIVEHPPVFTLGLAADRSHVLTPHDIPIVQTDRGGEVTYHGPGQVVIYLLMDLRRAAPGARLFAREFVQKSSRLLSIRWRRIISQANASRARRAFMSPKVCGKVPKSQRWA